MRAIAVIYVGSSSGSMTLPSIKSMTMYPQLSLSRKYRWTFGMRTLWGSTFRVRNKWPKLAHAQPPKIDYLQVNKLTISTTTAPIPLIRTRKSRARHFTPPPDLSFLKCQIKTPQRCGVLYAKVFSQELNIPIPQELIHKVTGVAPRI
jgi:hypothetical protein